MKKIFYFILLTFAFQVGLKLGIWKTREQYFGQDDGKKRRSE